MKKLFLLAVVFALLGGVAFADEISVGIEVFGGINFLEGSSAKKVYDEEKSKPGEDPVWKADEVHTTGLNGGMGRVRLNASGQNEAGTLGGNLRFDTDGGDVQGDGWVWWQPISMFRLQIGTNAGDGEFGLDGIGGWGFYAVAHDVGLISSGNVWGGGYAGPANIKVRDAYYGGFNGGIILTLTPLEALKINIGIPVFDTFQGGTKFGGRSEAIFKHTHGQVTYDLANIGTVGFSIEGDMTEKRHIPYDPSSPENGDNPKMYLYFGLTAIENLGLDIGLGYKLPDSWKEEGYGTTTVYNPFYVGLGASYNAGPIGVKLRTTMGFGGGVETKPESGDTVKPVPAPFRMLIDILPSYAVNDNLTVLLSAGLGIRGKSKQRKEPGKNEFEDAKYGPDDKTTDMVAWHVQPYITLKTSGWWAPNFYAGFRIQSGGDSYEKGVQDSIAGKYGDKYINWAIPVGIAVAF